MKKYVTEFDSSQWEVIDLDTNKPIRGVQFADDESGNYRVLDLDEEGFPKYKTCPACKNSEVIILDKKGNIKLTKKSIGELKWKNHLLLQK